MAPQQSRRLSAIGSASEAGAGFCPKLQTTGDGAFVSAIRDLKHTLH
jgi:hypothetical protein